MVNGDLWHEIHSRFKLKESKKSIARSLDLSVQTVRKTLHQKEPKRYRRLAQKSSLLTPYEDYIRQRLAAVGHCARSVYEELQGMGFTGGYDTVKRFVRPLRKEALTQATIRYETPPGRQGQVDWGQCWSTLSGKRVKVHIFVMTLGYSRRMFAKGAYDEKLPTFLTCHTEAFDHFGGIPHELLYDNTKTVVLSRDFDGRNIKWNSTFWDFSGYYGFRSRVHRPYRAQTKGKVESGVKYVKRFLRGKAFENLDHLNAVLMDWISNIADQRIHGTTHRKPAEMFLEENELLISHAGNPPYIVREHSVRHVSRDCMVNFETNRYSVPASLVSKSVEVHGEGELIRIYHDGRLVVVHDRCEGSYQSRINREHYLGIPGTEHVSGFSRRVTPSEHEVQVRDLAFYEALVEGGAI